MDIVIDFDGTVVTHEYPKTGRDIGAVPVLKELLENGHHLILATMRPKDKTLAEALEWFRSNGIKLYGLDKNPTQEQWTDSLKAHGDLYIDDRALGCPLCYSQGEQPYVDWVRVRQFLVRRGIIKPVPEKLEVGAVKKSIQDSLNQIEQSFYNVI